MKLVYQLSAGDLIDATFASTEAEGVYRRNRKLRAWIGSGAIALVCALISLRIGRVGWETWFVFAIVLGGYLLFTFWDDRTQRRKILMAAFKKSRRGEGAVPVTLELLAEHLVIAEPTVRTELAYAGIDKIEHLEGLTLLHTGPLSTQVIAHQTVSEGVLADFCKELAKRCRDATRPA